MSFILDALKKSENARQRQIGPSFADVPARRRDGEKPWWAFAVAGLLLVNLVVLAVVLMRDGSAGAVSSGARSTDQATPESAPRATIEQSALPPQAMDRESQTPLPASASRLPRETRPVPRRSEPSLAEQAFDADPELAPEAHPDLAAAARVPDGPPLVRRVEPPAVSPLQEPLDRGAQAREVLPTFDELLASGRRLPEMHLDIHVYSGNAAERFVFVNMRKYTEGQVLSEGPRLERITREGVVLNQDGLRFVLARR